MRAFVLRMLPYFNKLGKLLPLLYFALSAWVVVRMVPHEAYNDPDTFWHIELGNYMTEHKTVLHHAIHTFYENKLPYVPHEFGFQIVVSFLYRSFGWAGTYLLTAFCLLLLTLGLYRLTRISRKELGLPEHHFLLFLAVMPVIYYIYLYYFTTRPQMISAFLIVWFFVFLREFRLRPSVRYALPMIAISMGIANIHAGVWPMLVVFTVMAAVESLLERSMTRWKAVTYALIAAIGVLNVGGLENVTYITKVTHNNFNMMINEWQPVNFSNPLQPRTILLLVFVGLLPFSVARSPFRWMFMLGILFLGVSSYKMNFFMWLFVLYFAGTALEMVPYRKVLTFPYKRWLFIGGLLAGLGWNVYTVFDSPPKVNDVRYPAQEMDYIMAQSPAGERPKVLARYGESGYVMFRGADVLTDGRQDPFVTEESKGVFGWTAFERSMKGFNLQLPDIVDYDKPDYVIVKKNTSSSMVRIWEEDFGKPVFTGNYGSVYRIENER